jgi:spermidine synthase
MPFPGTERYFKVFVSSTTRLFLIGFISILGQVILLRELSVAFYGVELIYTLAIGVWLIFNGLGTMIGRRRKDPPSTRIHFLFLLLSVAIPTGIAFIRSIRITFYGTPGAYLPLFIQIAAMAAALLPFGLLLGLLFRWTARIYIREGKSLATAYALESLGGIAGGLCSTLFLKFGLQNFVIGLLCALAAVIPAIPGAKGKGARLLRPAGAATAALWILCLWNASYLDNFMTSWTHPNLVITRDSPYSRITVSRLEHQVAVFENDTLMFDSEGIRAEEFVHLSILQHPNPERVLVLGGGIEGILAEIQPYGPQAVDYVELNPVLLEITRTQLPKKVRDSLEAANVRVITQDPRNYLTKASSYDLILVGMPEPYSGEANRFYTLEFFQQCAERLNPRGILAFRLPGSENYMSPQRTLRMASVFRAAKSAFPEVMVLPGNNTIFLCSAAPLTSDPDELAMWMRSRNIKSRIVTPAYIRYVFTNNRFLETADALKSTEAPVNTDIRPICFQYTLMIWLSKFMPSMIHWDFPILEVSDSLALFSSCSVILLIPALLFMRAGWKIRRTVITGIAGFVGMVLETVLLLRFQIKNGVLFQDVGILLTSFMIGLVLGAAVAGKARHPLSRWMGTGIFMGFSLLGGFVGLAIRFDHSASLPATFILLLLSGFLVAGAFVYAGLKEPGDQQNSVAPLFSADLVGGGIGSILASLVMVPIAGLSLSVFLLIPLSMLSLLLVLKSG